MGDEQNDAQGQTASPEGVAEEDPSSGWTSFWGAVKKGAGATGKGLLTLYRLSATNSHYVLPVLNGFIGDKLAAAGDDKAIEMSFRQHGRDTPLAELELEHRLQGPGRTVVVLVHGLMCDEVIFQETRWQATSPEKPGYGQRVQDELGATVLYLRYNSGLHISLNGQLLSGLLEAVVERYGERIDRLVLIGHSMGGLVLRSAGHYGAAEKARWVDKLSTMVLVSVPNQGSYLEQLANLTAFVLNRIPNIYTGLGGQIIDQRSDGIKDLRFGLMVDEDWKGRPYDDRLFTERTVVEPLPGVGYHVLVGTLQENDASPVALYFGDGLVGKRSAMGEALFSPADPLTERGAYKVFPATGHFTILTHPEVGRYVTDVVRRAPGHAPPELASPANGSDE